MSVPPISTHGRTHVSGAGESGSALLWAVLVMVTVGAIIASSSLHMVANRKQTDASYRQVTLANAFARSGLTDALAWYRRQPRQPVTRFEPKRDPDGEPPILDTLDPTLGLVREFEVRGDLWGRYELRHEEVVDVSTEHGRSTPGTVWDLGVRAFVFQRRDPEAPHDTAPNRVVARSALHAEMRGISLQPPAPAAVAAPDGGDLRIGSEGRVLGLDGAGVAVRSDESVPLYDRSRVSGSPPAIAVPGYDASPRRVFGMDLDTLREFSDVVIESDHREDGLIQGLLGTVEDTADGTLGGSWLPEQESDPVIGVITSTTETLADDLTLSSETSTGEARRDFFERHWATRRYTVAGGAAAPRVFEARDAVVFVDGDLVVAPDETLRGRVLLVVDGNLDVPAGTDSRLEGVVYVTRDARIRGPFELRGMLVLGGRLDLGANGDAAVVRYERDIVGSLRQAVARYRLSAALRTEAPATIDG